MTFFFFVHKCSHFSDKNKLAFLFYITFPEIHATNLKYFGNASRKSGLGSCLCSLQELLKSSRTAWIREKYLVQTVTIQLTTLWSALWPSQGPLAQETCVVACLLLTPLLSTSTLGSRPQGKCTFFGALPNLQPQLSTAIMGTKGLEETAISLSS